MTHLPTSGIADEVLAHRRTSPIGATQRHFVLEPVLITDAGVCSGVVVVEGLRGTYVYASDRDGDIAIHTDPELSVAPGGTAAEGMLAVMGYEVAASERLQLRDPADLSRKTATGINHYSAPPVTGLHTFP